MVLPALQGKYIFCSDLAADLGKVRMLSSVQKARIEIGMLRYLWHAGNNYLQGQTRPGPLDFQFVLPSTPGPH